jgi:hypothetical protein
MLDVVLMIVVLGTTVVAIAVDLAVLVVWLAIMTA